MAAASAEAFGALGAASRAPEAPRTEQLVRVRGQQSVVSNASINHQPQDQLAVTWIPGKTLVTLISVSYDDLGDELIAVWVDEPSRVRRGHTCLQRRSSPEMRGELVDALGSRGEPHMVSHRARSPDQRGST